MNATLTHAAEAAEQMLPVVLFLMAILAVSASCADRGLFDALGSRLQVGSASRLLTLVFAMAVGVTALLSLDATVVLLTPVVVAAARRSGLDPTPGALAAVRLANSSSLILPISNLTTLLAMQRLDLGLGRFVLIMAPVWLVAIAVEYVGHRLAFRHDLLDARAPTGPVEHPRLPRWPSLVVSIMLAGIVVLPLLGIAQDWSAAVCAIVAALLLTSRSTLGALHPGMPIAVIALAVLVDWLSRAGLDPWLRRLLPDSTGSHSLLALLAIAVIATLTSAVVNNLPATLLLVPLLAPLGTEALLAGLIGLNVGSSLVLTGSLANLLWRRTLRQVGEPADLRLFHRVSWAITPVAVIACTTTLWAWASIAL